MRGEDHNGVIRRFLKIIDKYRASIPKISNDMCIVDDLVIDIDRLRKDFQGLFHNVNCPLNPCAETPRLG